MHFLFMPSSNTMRNSAKAREDAIAWLAANVFGDMELEIVESRTEEFPVGWVYYYQSALFLRTQQLEHSLIGNAPVFVPRNGASPMFISYHRPTSESMEAFAFCADANATPRAEIELKGWVKGARKISANKAIRAHSSLGLSDAHDAVGRCLAGQAVQIQTESVSAARELVSELAGFGFIAAVAYGD